MPPVLLQHDEGPVRVLTLNRPEKRNALNHALADALHQGLARADRDPTVRAVVLHGAGPGFCAGGDRDEFDAGDPDRGQRIADRSESVRRLYQTLSTIGTPVIAAVHGFAIGGGCSLALAADLIVSADDARFRYPELRNGAVASFAVANLVHQLGRKSAFELIALGHTVGAARAQRLGLLNRVVPGADLLPAAMEWAQHLAALPGPAMQATKRLFHRCADLPNGAALEAARAANTISLTAQSGLRQGKG